MCLVKRLNKFPGNKQVLGIFGDRAAFFRVSKKCGSIGAGMFEYISERSSFYSKQNYGPSGGLWIMWFGISPMIMINCPELVEPVISPNGLNKKGKAYGVLRELFGLGLVTSTGDKWKSDRKIFSPAFNSTRAKCFMPSLNANARTLIQILREKAKLNNNIVDDIREPMLRCTLDMICETQVGQEINAQRDMAINYVDAADHVTKTLIERLFDPYTSIPSVFKWFQYTHFREYERQLKSVKTFTRSLIDRRIEKVRTAALHEEATDEVVRKEPAVDIIIRRHLRSPQLITIAGIQEHVDSFIAAGYDTTAWAIIWACVLLGLHPQKQKKLREEVDFVFSERDLDDQDITHDHLNEFKYADAVFQETLRLYPTAPFITRRCDRELKIGDYVCPAGVDVGIPIWTLHRNSEHWEKPDDFIPERFMEEGKSRHPYAFIPFSAGPRNCIGQKMARLEAKIILVKMVRSFHITSLRPLTDIQHAYTIVDKSFEKIGLKLVDRNDNSANGNAA